MQSEIYQQVNGFNLTKELSYQRKGIHFHPPANVELPPPVDWRVLGAVAEKTEDQQKCADSWAYSATGSLEGQVARRLGKLILLSVHQIRDCTSISGNDGCSGGTMNNAFEYLKEVGLARSSEYPKGENAQFCRARASDAVAKIKNFVILPPMDEEAMKAAVATAGPLAAAVSASNDNFIFYGGGIFTGELCNPSNLDHAVLVVGYGSENGRDFWILKNSWGPTWGEEGYMRLLRNSGNVCGVASAVSYPVL